MPNHHLTLVGMSCGVRDPTFWQGNSSSFGIVGEYNPENNTSGNFIN